MSRASTACTSTGLSALRVFRGRSSSCIHPELKAPARGPVRPSTASSRGWSAQGRSRTAQPASGASECLTGPSTPARWARDGPTLRVLLALLLSSVVRAIMVAGSVGAASSHLARSRCSERAEKFGDGADLDAGPSSRWHLDAVHAAGSSHAITATGSILRAGRAPGREVPRARHGARSSLAALGEGTGPAGFDAMRFRACRPCWGAPRHRQPPVPARRGHLNAVSPMLDGVEFSDWNDGGEHERGEPSARLPPASAGDVARR